MSLTFTPAKRANVPLLISLAGGTGSGKTMSALILAKGLAGDRPFYGIDTENGRMLHYADDFDFRHGALNAPFRPDRYADAIEAAIKDANELRPVVVVDSFSHEHAGEGGLLDWHEEELERMAGSDWKKRERMKMAAWIKPKMAHKAMVNRLLQVGAHLILCLRAETKIEIVKVDGKTEIVPKQSLVGLDGWIPIAEKNLPFEMTASFMLTADAPGVPKPIKLPEQFKPFFPLDRPIGVDTGRALARWASGAVESAPREEPAPTGEEPGQTAFQIPASAIDAAALMVIPERRTSRGEVSAASGQTLAGLAASEDGIAWFSWALRQSELFWPSEFRAALELFVEHRLPAVWADREKAAA